MVAAAGIWELLTSAGGTLALTLIIALAVGINALTLLFVGSAVVTLERFAQVAQRASSVVGCGLVWTLVVAAGGLYWTADSTPVADAGDPLGRSAMAVLVSAGAVTVAMLLTRLVLSRIPPARLADGVLALLGVGAALVLGATASLLHSGAPVLVAGGLALALRLRRRRRGLGAAGDAERLLTVLAGALAVAVFVALALPEPREAVAAAGGGLLAALGAGVLLGLVPLAAAGLIDARQRAEWFIAVRYLLAKRRQTFISIITGICVIGIAAGVWLIITVLSVMNGFERTWRDEIIGNRAHLTVQHGFGPIADYERVIEIIEATPDVLGASPFLDAEGMVRGGAGEIMAVRVRGIDPARITDVTDLRSDMVSGSLEALASDAEVPGIVVGSQLAGALGLSVDDPLVLISPFGGPQTPLGPAPRLKRFVVAGVFESSFFQYDEMFTYVSLPAARDFRRAEDVVDGIDVRTTDFYRSLAVGEALQTALGFPFFTRDWKEFFPAFFQALKSERVMMFVLLTMIMVVAAFSIVSTLVMMIMEKSSDIAILKAMGAEDEAIERIFAIEGTLIGLVGTALGVVAGVSVTTRIAWVQRQVEALTGIDTLPANIYQFSTLPAELDVGQIAVAVGLAMILSLGATLLPSRQAARLDPVEALRYE